MQIINKVTGQIIDNGLDERNAGILIDEYQDDDLVIVEDDYAFDKQS
jgi:ATP-dependent exoDNAse (exonuclease V) beta subunit